MLAELFHGTTPSVPHPSQVLAELELNYTHFVDGANDGKRQVFLTPGIVIARIPLYKRIALTFGGGFQIAATHFHTTKDNGTVSQPASRSESRASGSLHL